MGQKLSYFILDTETSGLKSGYHEITECSIIRCSDRMQFTRKVKANYPVRASYDALQITGQNFRGLSYGIAQSQLIQDVNNFFASDGNSPNHRCIIAHNASFDRNFLHCLWKEYNQNFPAEFWLDSKDLAKRKLKAMGIRSLFSSSVAVSSSSTSRSLPTPTAPRATRERPIPSGSI